MSDSTRNHSLEGKDASSEELDEGLYVDELDEGLYVDQDLDNDIKGSVNRKINVDINISEEKQRMGRMGALFTFLTIILMWVVIGAVMITTMKSPSEFRVPHALVITSAILACVAMCGKFMSAVLESSRESNAEAEAVSSIVSTALKQRVGKD